MNERRLVFLIEESVPRSSKTRDDDSTLEAIYGAALAPEKWPEALGAVAAELLATSGFCFSTHSETDPGAVLHVHNQSVEMLDQFGSYWHTEDEWALAAHRRGFMKLGPRMPAVLLGSELVPNGQLVKTPFYNEFCLPHDMTAMMGTILFDGSEEDGMPFTNLCFYRPPSHPDFEAEHKERLARLLPHFRRAARIQWRVTAAVNEQARNALGAIHVASIVLDSRGSIQHTNELGREFLETLPAGCVQFGQLRSLGSKCAPEMRQAMSACSDSNPVRISAYSAEPQARVIGATLVRFLSNCAVMTQAQGDDRYLLLVDLPRAKGAQVAASVAQLFGLSVAEVRVLGRLLDGQIPADIAALSGISLPTVRTQISSLLSKTCTRGQSELVLLLRDIRR
jgi:DNA-binding CsgD family transcriptional regulator